MRAVAKIDESGFYLEPVLIGDGAPLPTGHAEITPFEGLHWPRWDGSGWVEGRPEAEIVASKAVVNAVGPPLRCLLSSIARENSERLARRHQTSEGAAVQYHCTTL